MSAEKPTGRFRRMLDRLSSSQGDLESEELREDAQASGCTRISDCNDRQIVRVTGTLRTVTLRPRAGVPALEAELFDGTAPLDVVWLGRLLHRGHRAGPQNDRLRPDLPEPRPHGCCSIPNTNSDRSDRSSR